MSVIEALQVLLRPEDSIDGENDYDSDAKKAREAFEEKLQVATRSEPGLGYIPTSATEKMAILAGNSDQRAKQEETAILLTWSPIRIISFIVRSLRSCPWLERARWCLRGIGRS
jgi:hypothetical protein